ncbi:endolytic transglycosylase MltG [Neobacillus thermocopriae]|uniref:Endolytic murein transglycosylase n=1 Tax=Neobacillus thermocopriae TaxID=1215031 RepID=A0A6B3TUA4_9BACI|nr:endolytic transglycosylase MltG [Neobacillus thermocopriae]MED3624496.1 endolytic transglycosylase MltG [Neobacillus thermocopriae]MED3715382.1 endolytic transglycosylase MltG [Neobacillus thermocopriae]NEX79581.1 endolytic transglycosylase MltG [Neobacillus thermocopriae]
MTGDKNDTFRQKMLEHQNEARIVRKIVLIISIILIFVFALIGGGGYLYIQSALKPVDPDSKVKKKVEIPIGSSVSSISEKLEKNGIIKDAKVFKYYVKFKNESGFMAGIYELSPSMDIQEIVDRLKTGKVLAEASFKITIPEGKQLKEIAAIMAKATNQDETQVFNQLNDKEFIKKLMNKYPDLLTSDILNPQIKYPLEGYLFPATYPFYKPNPTVEEMVIAMLNKSQHVLSDYIERGKEKNLTVHQLLTMASLIEEEATEQADRKRIASVFYNRIEKGMMLQTDPTVLYAQGKHKERVVYKDLEVDSPYNTYKHTGLPPGPIANAGRVSLEAAVDPEESDFYYFLATSDGKVIFTKTLEEHNKEKAKHITNKK